MDEQTCIALEGAIKKWEDIVAGTGIDRGGSNCPLCVIFLEDACKDCPVRVKTGHPQCRTTPWIQWVSATMGMDFPRRVTNERQRAAAQAELDFLRSLRP